MTLAAPLSRVASSGIQRSSSGATGRASARHQYLIPVALLRSMSFAGHFVTRLPTSLSQRGAGSARVGGSASGSFAPVEPERPGV
ncbi:MAG: hypothetical protein AB7F32_13640, partial [Victivallaceae bacterium]